MKRETEAERAEFTELFAGFVCGQVKVVKNGVFWVVTPCGSRRNNPEDTLLHSHRRENLKSYKLRWSLTGRRRLDCFFLPFVGTVFKLRI
jgi:hypothetical protein